MRRMIPALLGLLLAFPGALAAQQQSSGKNQDLSEAVRKARAAKQNVPKAKFVFTNDNIPQAPWSGPSVGGATGSSAEAGSNAAAEGEQGKKLAAGEEDKNKDEAGWRKKFADARSKLATAEKELDILQRELNLNQQQYYSDPNKALREQYTRSDINKGRGAIDAKKAEVEQLRRAISDLEDDLRRAGGPPAWSRP